MTPRRAPLAEAAVIAATVGPSLGLPGGTELLTDLADAARVAFGAAAQVAATAEVQRALGTTA